MCLFLQDDFANGFVGQMALAFEAASGDPGKGVEHAKVGVREESEILVQRIGDEVVNLLSNGPVPLVLS